MCSLFRRKKNFTCVAPDSIDRRLREDLDFRPLEPRSISSMRSADRLIFTGNILYRIKYAAVWNIRIAIRAANCYYGCTTFFVTSHYYYGRQAIPILFVL